jgi:4-diphosphocytidyl-2-C-methyl-D-erythritol kinase
VSDGVDVFLEKRIPIAAGLGGGSSNAAITIMSLNQLWNLNLSVSWLSAIASQFGSDINFFLEGGCSLGENRGELITPMQDVSIATILLVNPGIKISAREAYGAVELPALSEAKQFVPGDLLNTAFNRLEKGIRKLYPAVDQLICGIRDCGAKVSMLSGSGSTCFGIFEDQSLLKKCQDRYQGMGYWTQSVKTISRSEYKNVL